MKKKYVSPKIEVHELDREISLVMASEEIQQVESQSQIDSSKEMPSTQNPSKEGHKDAFGGKTPFEER